MEPLFPEFNRITTFDGQYNRIYLSTVIRKKFRGKWYLQKVSREYLIKPEANISAWIIESISAFIREVYKHLVLSKLDIKLESLLGEKIFIVDSDQRSEVEKITDRYCKI